MHGNVVANVVEQEDMPEIGGEWVDVTGEFVGPGFTHSGGAWLPPPVEE
jgi:hypothetical protein